MAARILRPLRPLPSASSGLRTISSAVRPPPPSFTAARRIPPKTPVPVIRKASSLPTEAPITPLPDAPPAPLDADTAGHDAHHGGVNWSTSFRGLSTEPFTPDVVAVLLRPLDAADIEIKPDGIIFLPEIKYRRILNQAFAPGGWGLAPRADLLVDKKVVSREYALIVHGRFIGQARGECTYFNEDGVATAAEGAKSNALMRCCKDLGIASELWDPRFIRQFRTQYCHEVWVEHVVSKQKRKIWLRKDSPPQYPFQVPTPASKGSTPTTKKTP